MEDVIMEEEIVKVEECDVKERNGINWLVRAKNKVFWLALIPAVLILLQAVLAVFGIDFDPSWWQARLLAVVESLFAVLVILGIVVDPTTKGIDDSKQAMTYKEPKGC